MESSSHCLTEECCCQLPASRGTREEARIITLQPGLLVCHTSANGLGAVERVQEFPGDCEYLHLNCQLDGVFEGRVGSQPLAFVRGDTSLGFSAGETFRVRHCPEFQNLAVMVTPQTLRDLVGEPAGAFLDQHPDGDFFMHTGVPCRKALRAAFTIAGLMNDAGNQRLLLHAATLEFLHWHLHAVHVCHQVPALSRRERQQLEHARSLLLQDLSSPPTIAELARAVGMNQYKLKAGFKKRFGCGIYGLFQEQRMRRARQLLGAHNVTETAVLVGYTNISHFSAAFRKQFGALPSEVRQQAG